MSVGVSVVGSEVVERDRLVLRNGEDEGVDVRVVVGRESGGGLGELSGVMVGNLSGWRDRAAGGVMPPLVVATQRRRRGRRRERLLAARWAPAMVVVVHACSGY